MRRWERRERDPVEIKNPEKVTARALGYTTRRWYVSVFFLSRSFVLFLWFIRGERVYALIRVSRERANRRRRRARDARLETIGMSEVSAGELD